MEERRRCAWLGGKLCDSTAGRKTLTGIYVQQRLTTTAQTRADKGQRRHRTAAPPRQVGVVVRLETLPSIDPIQDSVCSNRRFAPNATRFDPPLASLLPRVVSKTRF